MFTSAHNNLTEIKIIDVSIGFIQYKLRDVIQKYGRIEKIHFTNGNNNMKAAMVMFLEFRLNIENTWAIPIEDTMARIVPTNEWKSILANHNQITIRLYGIN